MTEMNTDQRTPSVFVAVGGPRQMYDAEWYRLLRSWASSMPRPKAILVFSAHWLNYPVQIGATKPAPLVYDYYNFPAHFYEVQYPAPPAPFLAERFEALLGDKLEITRTDRGLDHGVFVGLMGMYPDADIPVLEVSIPTFDPQTLFAIGHHLAPLRDEGVMVMGAGLMTHSGESPRANADFTAWVADTIDRRDVESLLRYEEIAPGVKQALPTVEHFLPLLLAYGAGYEGGREVQIGANSGNMRCLQFN